MRTIKSWFFKLNPTFNHLHWQIGSVRLRILNHSNKNCWNMRSTYHRAWWWRPVPSLQCLACETCWMKSLTPYLTPGWFKECSRKKSKTYNSFGKNHVTNLVNVSSISSMHASSPQSSRRCLILLRFPRGNTQSRITSKARCKILWQSRLTLKYATSNAFYLQM